MKANTTSHSQAPNATNDPHAKARKIVHECTSCIAHLWTKDFEFIDCNDLATEAFGTDRQTLLKNITNFFPPLQKNGEHTNTAARRYITKAIEEGFIAFDWSFNNKDGDILSANVSLVRHIIDDNTYVIAYAPETNLYAETPKEVQQAYKNTQLLLKHLPIGVDFWDSFNTIIDCNESSLRLFGIDSKEEYFEKFITLSPEFQPDGQRSENVIAEKFKEAAINGHTRFEWLHTTPDGNDLPLDITLVSTKSDSGNMTVVYYNDLRDIKAGLKHLDRLQQRLKYIMDSAPYSITMWDENFKPLDCNLATINFFGFKDRDDFYHNFHKSFPSFKATGQYPSSIFVKLFQDVYENGFATYEGELIHVDNNETFFVEATLRQLEIHGKQFVVAYLNDITYQKAMLTEIVQSHREISIARDTAEKSTRVKGEFLANMSHEIRTPMNGILGLLNLLSFTKLEEQQQAYVDKIRYSAESLLRIINDILDFSKIEAGKLEIEHTAFTLAEIQEDLITLLSPKFHEKNLHCQIFPDGPIKTKLIGDPLRLKQVLLNLLSNAIKFTDQGSVIASVEINPDQEKNLVFCKFSVTDSGIGLTEDQVANLFKAFSQADTSTTRKYGGTGLGLVISQSIVEIMNGKIWVESVYGQGSTFHFTAEFELDNNSTQEQEDDFLASLEALAPMNNEQLVAQSDKLEKSSAARTTPSPHCYHLLLVEDNEINQLIAKELLEAQGYHVNIANNGQEAVEMIYKSKYDLVLMDIQMPIMDGLTAASKIREDASFAMMPIIAMSAHAMKGDKEISLSHGMNDHLSKPIDPEQLYSSLKHWLGKDK